MPKYINNSVNNLNIIKSSFLLRDSCFAAQSPNLDGQYGSLQGVYLAHRVVVCDGVTPNCFAYEGHSDTWAWNNIGSLHAVRTQVIIDTT